MTTNSPAKERAQDPHLALVQRAQAIAREYAHLPASSVDEFLAKRRQESGE